MAISATEERVMSLCEILKAYAGRHRAPRGAYPARLTRDYLEAIASRAEGDHDKLALLREIQCLRDTVCGGAELLRFRDRPDGLEERAWQIMADRYAQEPCVVEMRVGEAGD